MKRKQSPLENYFKLLLQSEGITEYEREYKFHPKRKWRIDFYFPKEGLAVELEGGVWKGKFGGHTSGAGYKKDCEKYNAMTLMGIRLLRYTSKDEMDEFVEHYDRIRREGTAVKISMTEDNIYNQAC